MNEERKDYVAPTLTAKVDITDKFDQVLIKAGETAEITKSTPHVYICKLPNGSEFALLKNELVTIN